MHQAHGIALKGKRMPFHGRMMIGWTPERLEWMMDNGLAWRGIKPPDWKPKPSGLRGWSFYLFRMLPKGIFK